MYTYNSDIKQKSGGKMEKSIGKIKIFGKRQALLACIDVGCLAFAYVFSRVFVPFSSTSVDIPADKFVLNFAVFAVAILASDFVFGIYSHVWRYASFSLYMRLIFANTFGGAVAFVIVWSLKLSVGIWQSISLVAISTLCELFLRLVYQLRHQKKHLAKQKDYKYVVIVGAGTIGTMLARELLYNKNSKYRPYCFVDIDKRKIGSRIMNLKVLNGNDENIIPIVKAMPVSAVILAFSENHGSRIEKLYAKYSETGFDIKVYDYPFGESKAASGGRRVLRELHIEDLLFRSPIKLENDKLSEYYSGKTILVTGGGGSIGSELCRQIAAKSPKKLIILDIYENNAYDIQQELKIRYGSALDVSVEIASVRDRERLESVFAFYRPQMVFHAAAHKHVPLMEHNPAEAVKNNCVGTANAADLAEKYGVEKFILISTDKAVNPTNVMGASKRMCEMIVQCRKDSSTSFAAVRFGNVLGSNGSVVPLFKKQIEAGGPVTITDKRIIRYFMTISEACGLLLQTGLQAERGELFVLDMGNPVKILDLAENMIRLAGFVPYRDIDIKEIGLRPGEKLYEELLVKTENTQISTHDMIFVEKDEPLSREEVARRLEILRSAVETSDDSDGFAAVRKAFFETVPSYRTPSEVNGGEEWRKIE